MKYNTLKSLAVLLLLAMFASACKDKNAEKRIAQLESEIADLKGSKTVDPNPPTFTADSEITPVEEKPDGPMAVLEFGSKEHDFGTIKEGAQVEHTFKFKNTGQVPLIIQDAQASCGCTVPDWSKNPIPVGGTGFVKAKFDSNGRTNLQQKTITVTANTFPKQSLLKFKVMVTPKVQEPPADGPRIN